LTIAESGSLSISAGTTVKFLPNGAINIKGDYLRLVDQAIQSGLHLTTMEAKKVLQNPRPGDWVGLRFYGREGNSRLEKVEIAYGGQGGYREVGCLWMQDASLQLINVSVSNCEGFAMSTDIASNPTIEKLNLDKGDILRRWELRNSNLEGSVERSHGKVDNSRWRAIVTGCAGLGGNH
jgi:hypothetical protein